MNRHVRLATESVRIGCGSSELRVRIVEFETIETQIAGEPVGGA